MTQTWSSVGETVAVLLVAGCTQVEVRHPPVHKVERLGLRPAVDLCLDALGEGVWGQLLAALPDEQEQGVALRVLHTELLGAYHAHLLGGGVGGNQQGLGRAAAVLLLQGHAEVVLYEHATRRWG